MYHLLKALIIAVCFTSCFRETILEEELPGFQAELAVLSIITPADSVFVQLQETLPYSGEVLEYNAWNISEALVILSDTSGHSITLNLINAQYGLFGASQETFPVSAGNTYFLSVNTPDGRSLKAETTLPSSAKAFDSVYVLTDSPFDMDGDYVSGIKITGRWKYPQDNYEYYIVRAIHYDSIVDTETGEVELRSYQNYLLDDIIQAGHTYEFSYSTTLNKSIYFPPRSIHTYRIDLLLISLNPTLADYLYAYESNESKELESDISDALFSFQGIMPTSNAIDGGRGIFGGYLIHKTTLNF